MAMTGGPDRGHASAGHRSLHDEAARDGGLEATAMYRWSSLVYQAVALFIGALPLLLPAAVAALTLDLGAAWSLVLVAVTVALAVTTLPAIVYAVTRPGWTATPSARFRMGAFWRGWRGSVRQFGPLAVLAVAFVLGIVLSSSDAAGVVRVLVIGGLATVCLVTTRAGTICGLFSFRTPDLLVLTLVMTVRDAAGTLFLAAVGAIGLLVAVSWPVYLLLAWVPLCALCAPATRGARQILEKQFTIDDGSRGNPAS